MDADINGKRIIAIEDATMEINRNLLLLQGDATTQTQGWKLQDAVDLINKFRAETMESVRKAIKSEFQATEDY